VRVKDDTAALEAIRALLVAHPKWKPYTAALFYARKNPEKGATPESVARRLAKKLKASKPPPEPPAPSPPTSGSPTAEKVSKMALRGGAASAGIGPPIRRR
jgi:hypothetical protein